MILLDVNEVAKVIRASSCKVRRLIKAKKIPYRLVGSRIFFLEEDVADYLKSCRVPVGDHNKEVAL